MCRDEVTCSVMNTARSVEFQPCYMEHEQLAVQNVCVTCHGQCYSYYEGAMFTWQ